MGSHKKIRKNIQKHFKNKHRFAKEKMFEHELSKNLFQEILDEDSSDLNSKEDVLDKLRNNDFENDRISFSEAIKKSKHSKMLTQYSISDLNKMKLFKVKGYNIGYALKLKDNKYSEIISVFNNEPNIRGIGVDLIKSAIKNGGCFLDHYDGFLTKFYEELGFVEIKRDKFNPLYDDNGEFEKQYGKQDIIHRIHKSCK